MGKARDEAGNIWETDAQGAPVRMLVPAQPSAVGQAIGNDPKLPGALTGQSLQNNRTAIDIQNAPLDRAGKELSNQRTSQDIGLDRSKFAAQLKNQYDTDSRVAEYRAVLPNVAAAMGAAKNKQGDLTVIYAWAKAMDPAGSVREGDTGLATSTSSYIQQARQYIAAINQGKGLPPEVRLGLINEMRNKGHQLSGAYEEARKQYSGLVTDAGMKADYIIGPHDGQKIIGIERKFKEENGLLGDQSGKPSSDTIVNEFNPDQSGFIDTMIRRGVPHKQAVDAFRQKFGDAGADLFAGQGKEYGASVAFAKRNPGYEPSLASVHNQRRTTPFEQANAGAVDALGSATIPLTGFAKGYTHAWDRAAQGLASIFGQDAPAAEADFTGLPSDPTTEMFGKLTGAGVLSAPLRSPALAGAAGNLLFGDSQKPGDMAADAGVGAVGGKVGDWLLRGMSGAIAPQTDEAAIRLHNEGVKLTPGRMIPGMSLFEDLAQSYPLIAGKIDAGKALTKETLNRVPANRALAPIGQSLPDNVPAGHEAVGYTKQALGQHYDDALDGQMIGLDPTYATRLNAIGARSNLRPQEFDQAAEILQREIGGAFQSGKTLGVINGNAYKKLDARLGQLGSKFNGSQNVYEHDIGKLIMDVKDQTRALARRQNPDLAASLRQADEGYANYKILERAAASNPADGLATPGQFRTAIRQSDRSVGKGATARGDALMQDFAKDASKIVPEARGSTGTTDRANISSTKAWLLGMLTSPLYSRPVTNGLEQLLMRQPGPAAKAVGNGLDLLPRGMFGAALPWYLQSGQ